MYAFVRKIVYCKVFVCYIMLLGVIVHWLVFVFIFVLIILFVVVVIRIASYMGA